MTTFKGRFLTVKQVASVLQIKPGRAYELIRLGLLPAVHMGRTVRVLDEDLQQWIENGGRGLRGA